MNNLNNENKSLYDRQTSYRERAEFEDDPSMIKIGRKDIDVYILFSLQQLMQNENKEITIVARGMLITKCILVAMILKNNYMKDLSLETTINMVVLGEDDSNIPTINIKISKPN